MSEGGAIRGWAAREGKVLRGKRIAITRPRSQAGELAASLAALGADVLLTPTIRLSDPPDPASLRRAACEANRFDWIVFTSANAVSRFWSSLREAGRDGSFLAGVSFCAIGPATAAALRREGAEADLLPDSYVAEAVGDALAAATELRGSRILYPHAELARGVVPETLRARGADVVEVVAYRTEPDSEATGELRRRLGRREIDLITFTSGSAVQNFVEMVGVEVGVAEIASIGPVTSARCRALGLTVHVEADPYSAEGLIAKIVEYFSAPPRE